MKTANDYQKICVMGLGYIGLPTASLLATKGFEVVGVDVSQKVVDTINKGEIHIVEPDLDILVKSAVHSGNLSASLEPCEADVFIIAVPTPFKDGGPGHISGKKPDLSYIESATKKISPYIKPGDLVILESTSPVGTTDEVVAEILKQADHAVGDNVYVSHCPERVLPGRILIELVENDRVVGGINDESTKVTVRFYERFVRGAVLATTAKTAEMVKLTENSSRDVQIAFANELSMICETENIDTWEVIELANRHPRVNILNPGPGVGGHCIAVDPWFIAAAAPDCTPLIQTARNVNDGKSHWVIEKVKTIATSLENQLARPPRIGCLGLAFKPDVDDLRESPALHITTELLVAGLEVLACEPNLHEHSTIKLHALEEVLAEADLLVFLVAHSPFKDLDLCGRNVFDLCGVTEPA